MIVPGMKGEFAETRSAPGGEIQQQGGAAGRVIVARVGMTVGVGLAGHHQPGRDLAPLQQGDGGLRRGEHAAAAVLQVEGERAPALEFRY